MQKMSGLAAIALLSAAIVGGSDDRVRPRLRAGLSTKGDGSPAARALGHVHTQSRKIPA